MSLKIRFLFSLFFLSFSFVFAQTEDVPLSSNVGDVNNDGKSDYKDVAIIWGLLNPNKNDRGGKHQPEIESFTASPSRLDFGQRSTLQWRITGNPSFISIDQDIGDVTNLRSKVVKPEVTTTYTLTAVNSEGSATKQVTVFVKPRLLSFTSSPQVVTSGEASTLRWNVKGELTRVSINRGVGNVTASNSVKVNPTKTTTYTITAVSSGGSVRREVTVFVRPKIVSFTANPTIVAPDTFSTLSWRINGEPTEVYIDQGVGDVTGLTEVEVSPGTATMTYAMTASNQHGSARKAVKVDVKDIPVIASFTANTTVLTSGESAVLRWRVTGSESLSLETSTESSISTEAVTGSSQTVQPTVTTTYTLTADNSSGSVTATVKVYVLKIISFTADPLITAPESSSQLSWEIEGEPTEVSINQDVGDVTGLDSVSVSPEQTTTYTLTARKTEGNRSRNLVKKVTVRVADIPVIESFTATPSFLTSSGSVVLRWRVTRSDSLSLETSTESSSSIDEEVTGSSKIVNPQTFTLYTLTATNSLGSATASLQVNFFNIVSFTADPVTIEVGSSSQLSWEIEGEPTTVSINQDVGDVTGSDSVFVSPEQTTIYTLTAQKTDGSTSKTLTNSVQVTATHPPVIESFTASKSLLVASGESTLLRWNVTGTRPLSVSLSKTEDSTTTPILSSLPFNSSIGQVPTATTIYTLTATDNTRTVTATVKVYVLKIKEFIAMPMYIIRGSRSELSWDIDGEPELVSIDNSVGANLGASGSRSVSPTATTTVYTLTAQKTDSSSAELKAVTQDVSVTFKEPATIEFFRANRPIISCAGSTCTLPSVNLRWNMYWTDTFSVISQQGGQEEEVISGDYTNAGGNTVVTPQATTVYTLTAENSASSVTEDVTVHVLKIMSFSARPSHISGSEHSVLSWDVVGEPDSISISNDQDDNVLDVTGSSDTIVTPEETTVYTLTVTKTEGRVTDNVTAMATVHKLRIRSFTADPEEITSGGSSSLSWDVGGGPGDVSIDNNVGTNLGASGSRSVSPTETTTYTLVATKNAGGRTKTVRESVSVAVTASGFSGDNKIQDCKECPKLSVVPTALLGQDSSINLENIDNDNSFSAIGIQKVTWEEWQMCVSEGVCEYYEFPETSLDHPAVGIHLGDISVYIDWLSSKTGKKYRLLEGQEWQSMIDYIVSGNVLANTDLDSFVIDENDLTLNSSAETSTYPDDLILDAGFRVVREDPLYDE